MRPGYAYMYQEVGSRGVSGNDPPEAKDQESFVKSRKTHKGVLVATRFGKFRCECWVGHLNDPGLVVLWGWGKERQIEAQLALYPDSWLHSTT